MSEFKFSCPDCQQHLQCEEHMSGLQIQCPNCRHLIRIPAVPSRTPQYSPDKIRAIYGNGIFRPEGRVDLPDGAAVELQFRLEPVAVPPSDQQKKLLAINAIIMEQAAQRAQPKRPAHRADGAV
jgi:predicted DNA-binding antitoxin AbrB/MazE fold protein